MINDGTYSTIYDILFSLTKVQDKELFDLILNKLTDSMVLDTNEKEVLDTFTGLCRDLNSIPTSGTLVSRDIAFQTAKLIQESSLEDITKIFIVNKKKMNLASIMTNASMELSTPGADIDKINEVVSDAFVRYNPKDIEEDSVSTADNTIIDKLLEDDEEIKGIPYGIECIDQVTPGIIPSSINVIAGYTGSMKTTLALNICYNAVTLEKNVLYISLEISKSDAFINIMTRHSMSAGQTPIKRTDVAKMRFKDKDKFRALATSLQELPGKFIVFDESDILSYSTATFDDLIRRANKEFESLNGHGTDIIIVDHMQLLKFDKNNSRMDPYMIVNQYASYFRQKAAKEEYAVVLLSQTSRGGYEYAVKHNGTYLLTGLAESNELERGATCVVSLYSSDNLVSSGEIQCQVLKNRYGERMLEPQTTPVRPEYYTIGNGIELKPQQVESVFNSDGSFENPFAQVSQQAEEIDLDSLLSGSV